MSLALAVDLFVTLTLAPPVPATVAGRLRVDAVVAVDLARGFSAALYTAAGFVGEACLMGEAGRDVAPLMEPS